MSSCVFTTLAIEDVYSVSLVSQCRMLEASLKIDIFCQYFNHPQEATAIVRLNKKLLLERDFTLLLSHATASPSVGKIAKCVSWRKIWDGALEQFYENTVYQLLEIGYVIFVIIMWMTTFCYICAMHILPL